MADWREKVDPILKPHLDTQIRETHRHKMAIECAEDKKTAQLWLAIASLSKQMFELNIKLNYIERALKEVAKTKVKDKTKQKEIDDIMKTISRF